MRFNKIILILILFVAGAGSPVLAQTGIKKGTYAPDFETTNPSGKKIKLSDLKGRIVLLDFWASWCLPCRMANPELVDLYQRYNEYGFEIFSISLDTKKEAWEKAIRNDGLIWPFHGSDLKGWDNGTGKLYQVEAIPATFLIDENGQVLEVGADIYKVSKRLKTMFEDQVFMYPHIVRDSLFFSDKVKYVIKDSSGTEVLKGRTQSIDLQGLVPGEYLCSFAGKEDRFIRKQFVEDNVTFYPVNVHDVVTLSRKASYEVFNKRGLVRLSANGNEIDMTHLPKGLYYISIDGKLYKVFKN